MEDRRRKTEDGRPKTEDLPSLQPEYLATRAEVDISKAGSNFSDHSAARADFQIGLKSVCDLPTAESGVYGDLEIAWGSSCNLEIALSRRKFEDGLKTGDRRRKIEDAHGSWGGWRSGDRRGSSCDLEIALSRPEMEISAIIEKKAFYPTGIKISGLTF